MKTLIFYWVMIFFVVTCHGFASDETDAFSMLEFRYGHRRETFNKEPNLEGKVEDFLLGLTKKETAVFEYTTEIDESLVDDEDELSKLVDGEAIAKYSTFKKVEILLKAIMGSVLTDPKYQFDKDDIPALTLADPLFSHYTIIDQVNDLSRDLVVKIRNDGYAGIDIPDIDLYGVKYISLFNQHGITKERFVHWFNEAFSDHESGFRMQNPGLSIQHYDPSRLFLKPNSVVRFDPKCIDPSSCDHSSLFEILDDEIEACYNKRPEVPFRSFKPKLAAEKNNRGGSNGAFGRKFGNPDTPGLSLVDRTSIDLSIFEFLNERRLNQEQRLVFKASMYLEYDPDEENIELSQNAQRALDNMMHNSK